MLPLQPSQHDDSEGGPRYSTCKHSTQSTRSSGAPPLFLFPAFGFGFAALLMMFVTLRQQFLNLMHKGNH